MDTIGEVVHKKFTYVYVSSDINIPVKVLEFSGKENSFRDLITSHFTRHNLLPEERQDFEKYLIKEYEGSKAKNKPENDTSGGFKLTPDFLSNTIDTAGSNYQVTLIYHKYNKTSNIFQIIPLTLPSKKNDFLGINCYIDSIGRVKNLPTNSRMTRLCSTDIRGDCFISRTYDDEDVFKRVDFTLEDYNELMENPPSAEGRWDVSKAFSNALSQDSLSKTQETVVKNQCENCKKVPINSITQINYIQEGSENQVLKICTGCKKVKYCSVKCQKDDWRFHRRICKL
uniref:MYND finger containing protein, putative n=1 Tax=Theileria annulata TaxID=5874 RepID=A0A3B0MG51_THEAN